MKTLNVNERTKERLIGCRIYDRETIDDIVNRLIDEHYEKVK